LDDKGKIGRTGWIVIGALGLAFAIYAYISENRLSTVKAESSFYLREKERLQIKIDTLETRSERLKIKRQKLKEDHSKIKTDEEILSTPLFTFLDSGSTWVNIRRSIGRAVVIDSIRYPPLLRQDTGRGDL
jgi:hypothetical protein